jgi:hypothetical protein
MFDCFSFMSANGVGWMIWAGGLFWLLVLALLVLGAVALIKHLRSDASDGPEASNAAMHRGAIS